HAQIHPRVLLHQFDGAIDAGNAANLATEQLLTTLPGKAVATFNIDALIDYRSRRPTISYDHGKFLEATHPSLTLELLRDDNGEEFLFLHGDEP
ncbi:PAC2 family protein, partial [Mycobacterium tuberculosis]